MDTDIKDRIIDLCEGFEDYLNEQMPFGDWAWHIHRETIAMRNQFSSVSDAIDCHDFIVNRIGHTLVAWGMDGRRARLVPPDKFFSNIRDHEIYIVKLEQYSVSDLCETGMIEFLWRTLHLLKLSRTKNNHQVVTGSKALHHLLPRLLPPIDGRYTARFFTPPDLDTTRDPNSHLKDLTKPHPNFHNIVLGFGCIARLIKEGHGTDYLSNLVSTTETATSESKLIDNAIMGFVQHHNL